METFNNFQHLLTHIFSSSNSNEEIAESNQATSECPARASPQVHIATEQQEIEGPSNSGAVGGSTTSTDNGQDQESPRRRLSSQEQIIRRYSVSKTPSPPLRRSPRHTDHGVNSSNEAVDSSQRPKDERKSPRPRINSQQQLVKVSKYIALRRPTLTTAILTWRALKCKPCSLVDRSHEDIRLNGYDTCTCLTDLENIYAEWHCKADFSLTHQQPYIDFATRRIDEARHMRAQRNPLGGRPHKLRLDYKLPARKWPIAVCCGGRAWVVRGQAHRLASGVCVACSGVVVVPD
ncbi:MAG: hypothetical protein Q9195_007066 [Heterodermia aff. obscurata]